DCDGVWNYSRAVCSSDQKEIGDGPQLFKMTKSKNNWGPSPISTLGEFGLIERLRKYTHAGPGVIKGIGDDTAVLAYRKDVYQLFTTDMMAEGVHFTKAMKPLAIGHKALAVNISDI